MKTYVKLLYFQFLWGVMAKKKLHTSPYGAPTKHVVKMVSLHGSYMHAIFKLKAHEASEIWTGLPHTFTKEGLLQLSG